MSLYIRERVPETYNVSRPKEPAQEDPINQQSDMVRSILGRSEPQQPSGIYQPKNSYIAPSDYDNHEVKNMEQTQTFNYSSFFPQTSKRVFGKQALIV